MRTTLKTTTALLACFPLILPVPAFTQTSTEIEACADPESEACLEATEKALTDAGETADTVVEGTVDAVEAEAAESVEAVEGAVDTKTEAEAEAEPEPEAEPKAEMEAEAAPVAEPEQEAEATAETEAQTEAETSTAAEAEAEAINEVAEDETEAEASDTAIAEETEADPEPAEVAVEAEPLPETDETVVDGDAESEIIAEDAPADEAGDASTDDAAAGEADAVVPTDESVAPEETAETAPTESEPTETGADVEATTITEAETEAMSGEVTESAAASKDAEASDVATETVTAETTRSSSEDFDSSIAREARADGDDDDDDGGISGLERALLVGAGALAVGALLSNNRQVVASSDDRVVVSGKDGGLQLIKDDNALLRQAGTQVQTETFSDGSTRTTAIREDGSRIVTIRDSQLRVQRRVSITPGGQEILLIDDTQEVEAVDRVALSANAASQTQLDAQNADALRQALAAQGAFDRRYSLSQVRNISEVRNQMPAIDLDNVTFASGSAAITPEEADELTALGQIIRDQISENPAEIFLIEGHTDAVGNPAYNLALSDRRAESVALALTEYFDVPPENLVVQGYGERFLKVPTEAAERLNRRATVRRITPLLRVASR